MRAFKAGFRPLEPAVVALYEGERKAAFDTLESYFAAGHDFLAGDHATIADIDLYGVAAVAHQGDYDVSAHPHVVAWMKRIEALPHFKPQATLLPQESRKA